MSGTWKPRTPLVGASALASGLAARRGDRCAGLRCRKKRTPRCNGADTGCNITGRESEPTSDGSFVAREFDEPPARETAEGGGPGAPLVPSLPPQGGTVAASEYREG